MQTKWLVVFAATLAGASILSAKTYSISLDQKTIVGQAQLRPGDYRVRLEGSKVAFIDRSNKTAAEVPVKVEDKQKKFEYTEVVSRKDGDAQRIEDIGLGGTRMQLDVE